MQSLVKDGKVLDFRYKKSALEFVYSFYVGDIYVGQLFGMTSKAKERVKTWSAVGRTPNKLCPMHGFASRSHASEFLLKLEGLI